MASLLPFLIIIVAFYLLLILPQQRRQKQVRQMQSSLAVGNKVLLNTGFFGTVREITDDYVGVEIADGVMVKVVRQSIGQVRPAESELPGIDTPLPAQEAEAGEGNAADADSIADADQTDADDTDNTEVPASETPEETAKRLGLDQTKGDK